MKLKFLFTLIFLFSTTAFAQTVDTVGIPKIYLQAGEKTPPPDSVTDGRPPRFMSDWQRYIASTKYYPDDAMAARITGTVQVAFLIEINGEVSEIHLENSVYPSIDAEAMRIAKNMKIQNWQSAKKDGKLYRCYLVIPFAFPFYQ